MGLTVALNDTLFADRQLYWDDGVRIGMYGAPCLHQTLFLAVRMVEHCNKLPREAVEPPPSEIFKAQIKPDKTKPEDMNWGEMKQITAVLGKQIMLHS